MKKPKSCRSCGVYSGNLTFEICDKPTHEQTDKARCSVATKNFRFILEIFVCLFGHEGPGDQLKIPGVDSQRHKLNTLDFLIFA